MKSFQYKSLPRLRTSLAVEADVARRTGIRAVKYARRQQPISSMFKTYTAESVADLQFDLAEQAR